MLASVPADLAKVPTVFIDHHVPRGLPAEAAVTSRYGEKGAPHQAYWRYMAQFALAIE